MTGRRLVVGRGVSGERTAIDLAPFKGPWLPCFASLIHPSVTLVFFHEIYSVLLGCYNWSGVRCVYVHIL
jgi:hypothetical protein